MALAISLPASLPAGWSRMPFGSMSLGFRRREWADDLPDQKQSESWLPESKALRLKPTFARAVPCLPSSKVEQPESWLALFQWADNKA